MKYILHHLGLGDHYICNGLVRKLLINEPNEIFNLFCKHHNTSTIIQMFKDIPQLNILSMKNDNNIYQYLKEINELKIIKIGCSHNPIKNGSLNWSELFYYHVNMPYDISYDYFKINRNIESENFLFDKIIKDKYYAISVLNSSYGKSSIKLQTDLPIYNISPLTNNALDWLTIIEKASEIHTIETSFICLFDRLTNITDNLYFYKIQSSKPSCPPKLRKKWKIIC